MKPEEFFGQIQDDAIVAAIQAAEARTSGEIRVFVSEQEIDDAVVAAQVTFSRLGMSRTRERNGVLIFIAPRTRRFAVIGDASIHERCGPEFWRSLVEEMSGCFKQGRFTEGLTLGITKAGELLATHFPRGSDDQNELPDRVERD